MSMAAAAHPEPRLVERRLTPRVAARFAVKLDCAGLPGELKVRSTDVGPKGICVETPSPFAIDSLRSVVLELPDVTLQLRAEARWQRENAASTAHLTGIRLLDLEPEATEKLWAFVHHRAGELAAFLRDRADSMADEMDEALDLAMFTRVAEFPVGHMIHSQGTQGERGDSAFIVYSGRVIVEAARGAARPLMLERVEPGGLFGGLPMVAGVAHVSSAVTDTEVVALEIDSLTYQHLMMCRPWAAHRISAAILRRQAAHLSRLLEATNGVGGGD